MAKKRRSEAAAKVFRKLVEEERANKMAKRAKEENVN